MLFFCSVLCCVLFCVVLSSAIISSRSDIVTLSVHLHIFFLAKEYRFLPNDSFDISKTRLGLIALNKFHSSKLPGPQEGKEHQDSSFSVFSEFFCLFVFLLCNIVSLSGIIFNKPNLLIPWLIVYLIGIISFYLVSFVVFSTLDREGFIPLIIGILLNTCWIAVKNAWSVLKKEDR
jgi:hypothetical protein